MACSTPTAATRSRCFDMLLLTKILRSQLLANGQDRGDHVPVVKLFSSVGAATWLLSELDADGDTLF
ncbi:MAG: DUF2958 domain-containing protein, partial [Pontixanthobacter sp.]